MAGKCGYHKVKQEAQHVADRGLLGWWFKGPGKHRLVCSGARIPDLWCRELSWEEDLYCHGNSGGVLGAYTTGEYRV